MYDRVIHLSLYYCCQAVHKGPCTSCSVVIYVLIKYWASARIFLWSTIVAKKITFLLDTDNFTQPQDEFLENMSD